MTLNYIWRGRPISAPEIYVAVRSPKMTSIVKEDNQTLRWDTLDPMTLGAGVFFPDIIFTEDGSVAPNPRWVIVEANAFANKVWTIRAALLPRVNAFIARNPIVKFQVGLDPANENENNVEVFEIMEQARPRYQNTMLGSRWEIRQTKKIRPTVFTPLFIALLGAESSWLAHTRHFVHTDNCAHCAERRVNTVERVRRFNWPIIGGKNGNRT